MTFSAGTIDLTPLLNAFVTVLAAIVTLHIVPWIQQKYGKERAETLILWAKVGVQAAEQIYKGQPQSGEQKKLYVLRFLESKGFTVDTDEIERAIEAAVFSLSTSERQLSA